MPRAALGQYLRKLKALFRKHGYQASVYGHFGDGLVHCRIPFNLRTEAGLRDWHDFLEEAANLVVGLGGTLSGEHGDGQARAELLERMYGAELVGAFREFKQIWDPDWLMNPGKVVSPYPITSNLRVGPSYQPPEMSHVFAFAEDDGSFPGAALRCVGVGKCRRTGSDEGVMCPSYMATREERHSTRGRARLLFEMVHGGAITDGWKSREVEEALDLCLACKGCKSDCPVHVDMATYKAEFRYHHYAGRLRPRAAYSMGLIHQWSRLAARMPRLANFATQTPGVSSMAKWLGGIAEERRMPAFATETFTAWHRRRRAGGIKHREPAVMLWPDTFNNYFRPGTAIAATHALEALGYHVMVPDQPVCCGRPLYDWGMLDRARKLWLRNIAALMPAIENGWPVVGLEPACVSAFRDELPNLMHGDEQAKWLAQNVLFLTEFLDREPAEIGKLPDAGKALAQLHCHHHAVLDQKAEGRVLSRLGLDHDTLASGCCGMAGSFGFEIDKYDVSMACGERVLLPAVRAADADTRIIANGFSCREQIEQGSGRATVHVAELLEEALAPEARGAEPLRSNAR